MDQCSWKIEKLEKENRFTCVNCGTVFLTTSRHIYNTCKGSPRGRCDYFGKFMSSEQCRSCGATAPVDLHWCNLLDKVCAENRQTPYLNCLSCHFWKPQSLSKPMDRAFCISLPYRQDRWERFIKDLPPDIETVLPKIERYTAISGDICKPPNWWKQGNGSWGCFQSHRNIIEQALNEKWDSVCIFEDDATFTPDFVKRLPEVMSELPTDWEMFYLGGQYIHLDRGKPKKISPNVVLPFNVNRTHGYILRGAGIKIAYKHLHRFFDWKNGYHIDHHYGRLHESRGIKVYSPTEWLIGQAAGSSNVSGKIERLRFWNTQVEEPKTPPLETVPFVPVIGLHSSGSSCLAGVLAKLGLHMGNSFSGQYGSNPNSQDKLCGFEPVGLVQLLEDAFPYPATDIKFKSEGAVDKWEQKLKKWIEEKKVEALDLGTIAGAKYPTLCFIGPQLLKVCGSNLKPIYIDRDLVKSNKSLVARDSNRLTPNTIIRCQAFLQKGKEWLRERVEGLTIDYEKLLTSPQIEIRRIIDYLEIKPTSKQIAEAIAWVEPKHNHQ